MEPEVIRNWLMAVNMLVSGLVFLFVFIDRRHRVSADSIAKLEDKIDNKLENYNAWLVQLSGDVLKNPSANDIVRLHDRIDDIHRDTQQTNLMIGKLMGQIDEISNSRRRRSDYEKT